MTNKTGYVGLMEAAQAAWPEDEAYGTFCTLRERLADSVGNADDRAHDLECFGRDVQHMRKVFGTESDAEQLITRYDTKLSELLRSDPSTASVTFAPMFPQLPFSQ